MHATTWLKFFKWKDRPAFTRAMSLRALLSGAALVGAGVTLCGCGNAKTTAGPTPAPTSAPAPGEVQTAWDNHFTAFGGGAGSAANSAERTKALDDIMKDYDSESVIATFNDKCIGSKDNTQVRDGYTEHKFESDGIRNFFDGLFTQLNTAPAASLTNVGPGGGNPVVLEGTNPEGNVFLTWRTAGLPADRDIKLATDSFSWKIKNGKAMIWKQNIVTTEEGKACSTGTKIANPCDTAPDPKPAMCAGWDNHFTAFGAGAGSAAGSPERTAELNKIMQDYTEASLVQVHDNTVETADGAAYSKFEGLSAIRGMFDGLFTAIKAKEQDKGDGSGDKTQGAIALGETRRYLFSVSSTGCMKMMCDARVLGELSGGYAPRETPRSQLLVGSSSWPADGFFHGHIADLKIWGSVVTWDVAFQEPRETWTDLPAPSSMQPSEELASKPTVLEEEVPPPLEQPAEKCAEVRSSELAESDVPETTSPPASRCRGNSGASGGSGGSGRCYPSHQPVQQVVDADATVEFRDEAVVNEAVINELPVREIDDSPPPGTPEEWAESPVYPGLMVPSQPLQMWQQHSAPS